MTLRVLIADDEPLARRRLQRLCAALDDVAVCAEAADGPSVLERVRSGGVDVVLLDIHMPGLSGVEAMELWPPDGPYVIFCTADADQAVRAFDVGAVDYLLKPVEAGRLRKALDRARKHQGARVERLPVSTRGGVVLVDPEEISHAVLDSGLVTIFTAQGEHITDFTLQELLDKLPAGKFERVHRKALVNLAHVARLEPLATGGYLAHMRRGQSVEVSRQAARGLRKRLGLRRAEEDP